MRDFKTTGDLKRLQDEIKYNGDTKYTYVVSMSFYYTLIYVLYSIECEVWLDVIETRYPYMSDVIALPPSMLRTRLTKTIVPGLDKLIECQEKNEWPEPDRDEMLADRDMKMYAPYFESSIQKDPSYIDLDM